MADFVFNIAKGRVAEFYNRVQTNDPANSALVITVLATAGLESDDTLKDKDTLADVVSGTTNEVTNTVNGSAWSAVGRKVLTDADLVALSTNLDDTNNWMDLDIPDRTWTAVAAGDGWSKLVVCYDSDTTAGTDANIIPLTAHDFVVTPDGSDITAVVATEGFFRAS